VNKILETAQCSSAKPPIGLGSIYSFAIVCLILLTVMMYGLPSAHATTATLDPGSGGGGEDSDVAGMLIEQIFEAFDGGFTMTVVASVRESLQDALNSGMRDTIYRFFEPVMTAVIILAIVIFGIKMATGATRHPLSEMVFLGIKVVFVAHFASMPDEYIDAIFVITEELMNIVTENLTEGGVAFSCANPNLPAPPSGEYEVWYEIDCILLSFLGFSGAGTIFSALFGLFSSIAFSGYLGIYIATTGISAFIGFLFAILRVTYIYVSSLLGIAFLLLLSPMFIPMILFKDTTQYFDKWLKLLSAFILQPVIQVAFVVFMVHVFNVVLFTSPTISIAKALTGSEIPNAADFDLQQFMQGINTHFENNLGITTGPIFEDVDEFEGFDEMAATWGSQLMSGERGQDPMNPLGSFAFRINQDALDLDAVDGLAGFDGAEQSIESIAQMEEMLVAFTVLGLVTMMLYSMMNVLSNMTRYLVERSFRLGVTYELPGEQNFQRGMQSFQQTAMSQSSMLPAMMDPAAGQTVRRDLQGNVYYNVGEAEEQQLRERGITLLPADEEPYDPMLSPYMAGWQAGVDELTPFNVGSLIGSAMDDTGTDNLQ